MIIILFHSLIKRVKNFIFFQLPANLLCVSFKHLQHILNLCLEYADYNSTYKFFHLIFTFCAILTDDPITFFNICFTHVSSKSISAVTWERVDSILTGSNILTEDFITVINISFTFVSSKSISAETVEGINIICTGSIVLANDSITIINLCLTFWSCEIWFTSAAVGVYVVITLTIVPTWVIYTWIW